MRTIQIENWKRKEYFEFFSQMDHPFFGIVTEVDCSIAYQKAKDEGHSFFASYLHKSILAVNEVEEFKYRIVNGQVMIFDEIHAAATIAREDETFGFAFMHFSKDLSIFTKELQKEIEEIQNGKGLRLNEDAVKIDLIHHSTFPWAPFSSLLHPRNFRNNDSIPKITFGGVHVTENRRVLPVSVEVHHGLADGLHIAKYLKAFQRLLDE